MPFALIAAALASLGIHATVLFGPEFDLSPGPEPVLLQAEIVLKPRAVPEQKPAAAVPAKKPLAPRAKPINNPAPDAPAVVAAPAAETAGPAGAAEAGAQEEAAPAELALPPRGEIIFTVTRGDPPAIIGRSVQSWELGNGSYRISSITETVGLAALIRPVRVDSESRGRIIASGLEPALFSSQRQDKASGERVEFDWAAGLVRFGNGKTSPLPAGSQDLLSFNFQLGWLSKTGDMSIATGKKLGRYRLELIGEELLETKLGFLTTLHFRAPGETTTEVWLAPAHHLLPVKIRHIDKKGESYDQLADEIRIPD
jgi:hypothetical protein